MYTLEGAHLAGWTEGQKQWARARTGNPPAATYRRPTIYHGRAIKRDDDPMQAEKCAALLLARIRQLECTCCGLLTEIGETGGFRLFFFLLCLEPVGDISVGAVVTLQRCTTAQRSSGCYSTQTTLDGALGLFAVPFQSGE